MVCGVVRAGGVYDVAGSAGADTIVRRNAELGADLVVAHRDLSPLVLALQPLLDGREVEVEVEVAGIGGLRLQSRLVDAKGSWHGLS